VDQQQVFHDRLLEFHFRPYDERRSQKGTRHGDDAANIQRLALEFLARSIGQLPRPAHGVTGLSRSYSHGAVVRFILDVDQT
jgi:hypothetical protein